jgi:hypothetical protein
MRAVNADPESIGDLVRIEGPRAATLRRPSNHCIRNLSPPACIRRVFLILILGFCGAGHSCERFLAPISSFGANWDRPAIFCKRS